MTTLVTTPFLRSLEPVDLRTRQGKVAQDYLRIKGFPDVRPLGMVDAGDTWYIYYDLPDGLLELEVSRVEGTNEYKRKVAGLETDPEKLREYLGH